MLVHNLKKIYIELDSSGVLILTNRFQSHCEPPFLPPLQRQNGAALDGCSILFLLSNFMSWVDLKGGIQQPPRTPYLCQAHFSSSQGCFLFFFILLPAHLTLSLSLFVSLQVRAPATRSRRRSTCAWWCRWRRSWLLWCCWWTAWPAARTGRSTLRWGGFSTSIKPTGGAFPTCETATWSRKEIIRQLFPLVVDAGVWRPLWRWDRLHSAGRRHALRPVPGWSVHSRCVPRGPAWTPTSPTTCPHHRLKASSLNSLFYQVCRIFELCFICDIFCFFSPEAPPGSQLARHTLSYIQEIGSGWFGQVTSDDIELQ